MVRWRDAVPEEIIEDVAALQSRLMLDAPPVTGGRRLGVIVKSANHAYTRAHEPALRVIDVER